MYEPALTLNELTEVIRSESGESGIRDLPSRLERAHRTGTSGIIGTLIDCISLNQAGEEEIELSIDDFIKKYLTLPTNIS